MKSPITRPSPRIDTAVFGTVICFAGCSMKCCVAAWTLVWSWALGRSNWLFAGSLRSGKQAAAIMSLIQSARMNGHDPYVYLKDVLTRLPMERANEITDLLPQNWVNSLG